MALSIMLQGTASDVGKSILVAGLCRIFYQDGYRVAPFKSQNMALNSGITAQGDEMGRAQLFQAEAAGIEADVRMNPILLKPTSDCQAQVVFMGKVFTQMEAVSYHQFKPQLLDQVVDTYNSLMDDYQIVVIEGAGSPAEINLRDRDIVNMGLAERIDVPVILVADIDRGGVFASIYGTLALISESDRQRIKGVIINKFRGDVALLTPAIETIETLTNVPVLGIMPFIELNIEDEDSVGLSQNKYAQVYNGNKPLDIAVVHLPYTANFTDFNPLSLQPDVHLRYVMRGGSLGEPDLLIIPGSKNTLGDLSYLYDSGLAAQIQQLHRQDVPIIGICGGYQLLGKRLIDGIESGIGEMEGLGLLDCETRFAKDKITAQVSGQIVGQSDGMFGGFAGIAINGYEIHMGHTELGVDAVPFSQLTSRNGEIMSSNDGAINRAGNVMGSYIHGLFDEGDFTRRLLNRLRVNKGLGQLNDGLSFKAFKQREYDKLAQSMRENIDIERIYQIMRQPKPQESFQQDDAL